MRTLTTVYTDLSAVGEPYGKDLNRVTVQNDGANLRTHLHVGDDAVITAQAYPADPNWCGGFVTVDIDSRGEHNTDTALFFSHRTQDQLVALRDACNAALRALRKFDKGA